MAIPLDKLERLPKVDLHRHLEGSVRVDTAREVAKEFGLDLPWSDDEAFRRCFQYCPGHNTYFSCFRKELWVTEEVIRRVATEAIADAAADGLVYLELRFSTDHYRACHGHSVRRVVDVLCDVVSGAPVRTGLIMVLSGGRGQTYEYVRPNLDVLREHRGTSAGPIVGVDLCPGRSWFNDPALFLRVLDEVRRIGGFPITIHVGEGTCADPVRTAICEYGAQRVGHGVGAWYDADVLDLVVSGRVPLEVCMTSNRDTGAIPQLADHPACRLLRAGACVTLNTDNPTISSGLTLTDEYRCALDVLGFSADELKMVLRNSIDAAFLPAEAKADLWSSASAAWDDVMGETGT